MRGTLTIKRIRNHPGFKIWHTVDGNLNALVNSENGRAPDVFQPGTEVDPSALNELPAESQPHCRVMVAAADHHLRAGYRNPFQCLVEELDDVNARQSAIIDITGNKHHVHVLLADRLLQLIDEKPLSLEHPNTVEGAAQVPV